MTADVPVQLAIGLAASGAIALLSWRKRALTGGGAAGAVVVGTAVFGCGGFGWGALLVTFFVTSSLLSRYRSDAKASLAETFAKGSRRDLGQVLANGGVGAILAVAFGVWPHPPLAAAFVAAMAAVTADTWATELGVLSRTPPRLLTTWKTVPAGTSGAVSVAGSLATVAAALVIGVAALLFGWFADRVDGGSVVATDWRLLPVALAGGVAGCLFDSLLGATVQAMYRSAATGKLTERPRDRNGTPNQLVRGLRFVGNDQVNFLSSAVGAFVGAAVWLLR